MSERRITPEEVLAAYKRHPEIKPDHHSYTRILPDWDKIENDDYTTTVVCACPLAVLCASENEYALTGSEAQGVAMWARDTFGNAYREGFVAAVDGEDTDPEWNERARQGYADGLAVAAAVFGETR